MITLSEDIILEINNRLGKIESQLKTEELEVITGIHTRLVNIESKLIDLDGLAHGKAKELVSEISNKLKNIESQLIVTDEQLKSNLAWMASNTERINTIEAQIIAKLDVMKEVIVKEVIPPLLIVKDRALEAQIIAKLDVMKEVIVKEVIPPLLKNKS